MSIGPLRRLVGALGLVAMVPLLVMVSLGALGVVDAAFRAAVMVLVLLFAGRVVGWGMDHLAADFESTDESSDRPSHAERSEAA